METVTFGHTSPMFSRFRIVSCALCRFARQAAVWLCLAFVVMLFGMVPIQAWAEPGSGNVQAITVGVVADNEPYSWVENGQVHGFSVDVLNDVAEHTGLNFSYRIGNWPELYPAFLRGEIDVIDEISYREDRAGLMLFTEPYHFRKAVIMQDRNRPLADLTRLEDLQPYRVGIVRDIYFKAAFTDRNIQVVEYDGLPSLIRALAFGWVDAIAGPEVTLSFLSRKAGLTQLEVAASLPMDGMEVEDFRLAVLPDRVDLHAVLSEGLRKIPAERLRELEQRWQEFGGRALIQDETARLSEQQLSYIRRLGPVRIGIMRDYAPFSFVDGGSVNGLAVDILARVQDLTGLQVIPVTDRWATLFDLFRRGEIDLITNISDSPDRREFARFTQPYHVIPNVVFTRLPNLRFEKLEDLSGLRIAVGSGIYYEAPLRERFGDAVVSFSAQEAMFTALAQDTVDVVLAALHNGHHWVRESGITDVRIAGELKVDGHEGEDLRFAVRPALEPLAAIIDRALAQISPTELRTIENRWLGAAMGPTAGSAVPSESVDQVVLTSEEEAYLDQRGRTLRICADPQFLPLEGLDEDGRHTGMAADFLALFAERSRVRFEVTPVRNWSDALAAGRSRNCDLFPMIMMTPERAGFLDFTSPLYVSPNVMLARREAPFIDGMSELEDQPIGVVQGYAYAELLRTRYPALNLVEVESEVEGLRRLQSGSLYGYVSTMISAGHYLNELGLADIKVIGRVPGDWTLALGTRNDQPVLHEIAQKWVDGISDVERRAIESKWRTVTLEQKLDYRVLLNVLIIAVAIFFVLFAWNRKLGQLNRQLADANALLEQYSLTDGLTEVGNRKYFDKEFVSTYHWCKRHQLGFMVAMIDIDHFKLVNDTYGHTVGDACLKALAQALREHFRRDTDRVARFGGEEFVVFASLGDDADMRSRLEALRIAVSNKVHRADGKTFHITISIGAFVAASCFGFTPEQALKRADDALYRAKHEGRNRLVMDAATA